MIIIFNKFRYINFSVKSNIYFIYLLYTICICKIVNDLLYNIDI